MSEPNSTLPWKKKHEGWYIIIQMYIGLFFGCALGSIFYYLPDANGRTNPEAFWDVMPGAWIGFTILMGLFALYDWYHRRRLNP